MFLSNPINVNGITSARFNMRATLLHQNTDYPGDINVDNYGEWVESQDPLTGEIIKVWKPYDDPTTPGNEDTLEIGTINCIARGIVDGGIRVAGTTERFGETYENIDFVKMWVPAHVRISKRDRVTNIMTPDGKIRWRDEEYADPADETVVPRATEFNVNGVTPLFDAFNRHNEQFVLLERAEVYSE